MCENMANQILNFIQNLFKIIYQVTYLALICAFLLSSLTFFICRNNWKAFLKKWWHTFRRNRQFRCRFFFLFSVFGILGITFLARRIWYTPWENVIGNFQLVSSGGRINEDSLNNILLFIPFSILLSASSFGTIERYTCKKGRLSYGRTLLCAMLISFLFSFSIECAQNIFWLGAFQLADLFFNTLGGLVGGCCYCAEKKMKSWFRK